MSLGEIIAQTLADCAELPVGELNSVIEWLDDEAVPVLSALAGETGGHELPEAVVHLVRGREAATDAVLLLESAIGRLTAYCERQGRLLDQDRALPEPSGLRGPAGDQARSVGSWAGKGAVEHVRDGGVSIGREPPHIAGKQQRARRRRVKPNHFIREVRSLAELDEIYAALTVGGRPVERAKYVGRLIELPDGTCVGYRRKSSSSDYPTVDIWNDRDKLKIHVNKEGWC
ncbi:hypothetical protein [Goodfellowiella coeruleoviolacea]|uniref:Uncharacterized protein n=1 Tax=Goodfellowiella coeruleoviolacea TaxID=334858 RepID=A0AAE3GAL6_9PSEU|nr:hypothetical protein [Goodfellowiella coeruleoviolacea]MCP2164746.1 hypothetical protein [Goodfellowiella coeruleoviolacea]